MDDVHSAAPDSSEAATARLKLVLAQGSDLKRKQSFDEVFIDLYSKHRYLLIKITKHIPLLMIFYKCEGSLEAVE